MFILSCRDNSILTRIVRFGGAVTIPYHSGRLSSTLGQVIVVSATPIVSDNVLVILASVLVLLSWLCRIHARLDIIRSTSMPIPSYCPGPNVFIAVFIGFSRLLGRVKGMFAVFVRTSHICT